MSIPKTQIIELRERNKKSVRDPSIAGAYKVILQKPVKLEEGDAISLHSAFIDTSANSSGLIDLQPDTPGATVSTISATFGYYAANIPSTAEGAFKGTGAGQASKIFAGGSLENNSDGKNYIACHKHVAAAATAETVFGINNDLEGQSGKGIPKMMDATIFITPLGDTAQKSIGAIVISNTGAGADFIRTLFQGTILEIDNDFYKKVDDFCAKNKVSNPIQSRVTFPFTSTINKIRVTEAMDSMFSGNVPPQFPAGSGLYPDALNFFKKNTNATGVQYLPIQKTISLALPPGKYTAAEVCHRLGLEFTRSDHGGAIPNTQGILTNNPLLPTIKQLRIEAAGGVSENQEIHFIEAETAYNNFQFDTSVAGAPFNYPIGSSQFGINYNEEDNKANFDMLHLSLLDVSQNNRAGLPEIREYAPNVGGNNEKFFANKHSGIYFIDLKPRSVWIDQLKFNPSIIAGGGKEVTTDINGTNSKVYLYNNIQADGTGDNSLVDGINITGQDIGLDTLIEKTYSLTADGQFVATAFDLVQTMPAFPGYLASTTADTIPIFGGSIINSAQYGSAEEGYYQIEIGMNVPSDIRGKDDFNNKIQGLVSKYYSAGSFTQSAGELGFEYIHKGADMILSSFSVRVLLPDNTPANDIQDNNTIFLKLLKQSN